MSIPREDQESSFLIDGEDNDYVQCYSCSPVYVRKLIAIAEAAGVEYSIPYPGSIRVNLPIECLLIRPPRKKREVSEEFRKAARERFNKMWQDKREENSEENKIEND